MAFQEIKNSNLLPYQEALAKNQSLNLLFQNQQKRINNFFNSNLSDREITIKQGLRGWKVIVNPPADSSFRKKFEKQYSNSSFETTPDNNDIFFIPYPNYLSFLSIKQALFLLFFSIILLIISIFLILKKPLL
jgi:hypothetical protein